MTVIFAITILSLLGLLLALILYFVAQKFRVEEDARIDDVEAILPGANCGGCGFAGCRAFAEACVKAGDIDSLFCPVGANGTMKLVAECLGVVAAVKAPQVAVLRCNGSCENREKSSIYDGYASCTVISFLYTGDTDCSYGCFGRGDCVSVCMFDAIQMDAVTGLPVVDEEKCTSCGACVKVCPKSILEIRNKGPKGRRVYVACMNEDKGGVAKKACSSACIACTKCQKVCAFDAITIDRNLAYIDYNRCKLCRKCVAECPTGAIVERNFRPEAHREVLTEQIN